MSFSANFMRDFKGSIASRTLTAAPELLAAAIPFLMVSGK